ncbi:hypothetical protein SAMN05444350_1744 [Bacteroides stercorirosoris]|uniref:Uncharacterized protein n=1 Tax=Bacteroides stercorirosoris TaxID=871324 RepID=A0A1M6MDK0_9BACE|nr:hypothetical protein SAMN05444350_1744 [Bacteroides stercorirosoris]
MYNTRTTEFVLGKRLKKNVRTKSLRPDIIQINLAEFIVTLLSLKQGG